MTYERLKLSRDCWWLNPSGDNYVSDENGNLSTYSHGIYKSINNYLGDNDSEYLKFNGTGEPLDAPEGGPVPTGSYTAKYTSRLNSTNLIPTRVDVGIRASTSLSLGTHADIFINGLEIGSVGITTGGSTNNNSGVINLNSTKQERIFDGRVEDNYDYFQIRFETSDSDDMNLNMYDIEVYYSGEATWDNHETGLPNVITTYHYPTRLGFRGGSVWADQNDSVVDSSGYYTIDIDPDDASADNTYIKHNNLPSTNAFWVTGDVMPSGGLSLFFTATSGSIEPLQSVTRANLNLRMSLPPSGLYENSRDTFEVNGYNRYAKEGDYIEDMSDYAGSRSLRHRQYGYFLYGAGDIVEASGFQTYTVELNFLQPSLWTANSGNVALEYHRNADIFANVEMQLVGLPSGVQLSAAELMLEQIPNNACTLYSAGDVYKNNTGVYPDTSGTNNISLGNGGWHHRGNREEWKTFDAFFNFSESSGVYTYPTTNNSLYLGTIGTYMDPSSATFAAKEPTRKNYYRNPIISSNSTRSPTHYRDAIKISYTDTMIGFADTIDIGYDFSLYFMIYADNTDDSLERYCVFYNRGASFYRELSFYHLDHNSVRLEIFGVNGNKYVLQVDYDYTDEPILVYANCQYSLATSRTTVNLYVHDDINNYFSKDWKSSSVSFNGYRRMAYVPLNEFGGKRTNDSSLFNDNFYIMEFGFNDGYIGLEDDLTDSTVQADYNVSTDVDKEFFSSRLSTSPYFENPGSGINWNVRTGSGEANWSTKFFIDDWIDEATHYELIAPVTTAYTNYLSHPSSIYVEANVSHATDHPSGVKLTCNIEFDSGSTDNWKVWQTELNIPSGSDYTTYTGTFKRHIGMNCGSISYSDIDNITMDLKTSYPNIVDTEYYGNLTIDSIKVYFDSYCVATTGNNNITLFQEGTYATSNNNIDLYLKNAGESNSNIDLYTYSVISSSDNITLYASGSPPQPDTTMNLYVNGLTPSEASGNFPLFTRGTPVGSGGSYSSIPLFVETAGLFEPEYMLPMFIKTDEYAEYTGNMNLFIKNDNTANNNISLFMLGPSGYNDETTLFIKGDGITDGAYPSNSNMNLYIARDSEAVCHNMPLYVSQKKVTHNFDMFVKGEIPATSSIPLYIYGSGIITNNTKLYTHGF